MQRLILHISALCVAALFLATAGVAIADPPSVSGGVTPRVVNVTSDSAPGWTPTVDMERQVQATAQKYLALQDSGNAATAYAQLADEQKARVTFADYSSNLIKFNAQAGPVKQRRIVKVSWSKDPAQAPAPGVYAALDLVSTFANIDRHCGYLVLYQAPSGGDFKVMREESNFMDNVTAKSIEQKQSSAAVDNAWAQLSANCPNYPVGEAPITEQSNSTIGYPSVASAMAALRARSDVVISNEGGWTVVEDNAAKTIWSLSPSSDPSYPSVVKRTIVGEKGGVAMEMQVLCQASKQACDNLVRQFKELNARLQAQMRGKR